MVLRKALYRCNASLHSAKLQGGFVDNSGAGFLLQHITDKTLTFSLDFKHAYGILRVERSDFAGGKRVSPLDSRRNGRCRLHWFDERLRANNGHPTALHSLPPSPKTGAWSAPPPLCRVSSVRPCEDDRMVGVRIYRTALTGCDSPAHLHLNI